MKRTLSILVLALLLSIPARADLGLQHALGALPSHGPRVVQQEGDSVYVPGRVDLSQYLPPVADQGFLPTCTAWALAYYYRSLQSRIWGRELTFSPTFLYELLGYCRRPNSMPVSDAISAIQAYGLGTIDEFPADPWQCRGICTWHADAAREYRAQTVELLFRGQGAANVNALRRHIATRDAFVVVVPVYPDWCSLWWRHDATITGPKADQRAYGWHTVCVVGYDDGRAAFKLVNSWGTSWGKAGFGWMSYDFLQRYAWEGWSMQPVPVQLEQRVRG